MKTEAQMRKLLADLATVQEATGGYDDSPEFHRGMVQMLAYALGEPTPGVPDDNQELREQAFQKLHERAQAIRRQKQ